METSRLANLFYRRPRLLVMTLALIVVAGLSSLQILPRTEDPELIDRWAMVYTYYPGATANRVESLVTERIEEELREIEEINLVYSTSRAGISSVVIELADDVAAVQTDQVWSQVRDRLADLEAVFPTGTAAPHFEEYRNEAWTMIVGFTWQLPGAPNRVILSRLADELGDSLRRVPGTEKVKIYGEPEEEITVAVDPAKLASYGLTVDDVAGAVSRNDSKIPAGQVRGANNQLFIEVAGELDSLKRIRNLAIHLGDDGRFLRLGDIGEVRKQFRQPDETLALVSGKTGVVVAARMMNDLRIDRWAASTTAQIEAFSQRLPQGVELTTLFDQSEYTEARLHTLFFNFLAASLLVTAVIFFSMGARSAILVGAALPLTSLMVLQGMNFLDIPIHQMSVTGLIIALGLLIDNAIIMVDEVRRRMDDGMPARDAVASAVSDLFVPLLGSTLTTIFAFMPIWLMPGPPGEFVGAIAKSVILALASSFFLAMTVVPALTGFIDRARRVASTVENSRPTWLQRGLSHQGLARRYEGALLWLTGHPLVSLGIAGCMPVLGFLGFTQLEEQFFPAAERDQFTVELGLPWQTSIEQTRRVALAAREEMLRHPAVEDVHWFLGESAPKFYYNLLESRRGVDSYGQAMVQLRSAEGGSEVLHQLQERLDEKFPNAQILTKQLEQGPPFDAPVELRLYGPDLRVLRELGEELRAELAAIPGVTHTRATLEGGQPKLMVDLDEEGARLAGYDNSAVANHLQGSLEGLTGGSMIENTEDLPVRVRVRRGDRFDVGPISALDLPSDGGWTPLAALSSLRLIADTAAIPHRNGRRYNNVQAFLVAGMLPNKAVVELERRLAARGFDMPAGYEFEFGGEAAERDKAVRKLMAAAFVLMVLMATSLVLSFNSFRMAAIIAGVGSLSIGLSLLALFVTEYPFGFMSIIGTMGLVGVAVNDSIVVLAALKKSPAAMAGDRRAVVQTVARATRHLVSTSFTTMAGFTPLILGGGGFWPPVAWAIGGGVGGATLLAVTFVPTMFLLTRRRR